MGMEFALSFNDTLPIYKLIIDEDDMVISGVDTISLVDSPAVERNWMAFNAHRELFQVVDKDRRIISGAAMVANLPIKRRDDIRGEFYVVFDKPTIAKIAQKFFRNGNQANVNVMHDGEQVDGVYVFESFLIDKTRGIKSPEGFDHLSDGSWFVSMKVENEAIWKELIKTGELTGFSVEGAFDFDFLQEAQLELIDKIRGVILA